MSGNTAWKNRSGPSQEQHFPVNGFNIQATHDALKKSYQSLTAKDLKANIYKPSGGAAPNSKQGGPWASKPNTMGNGKDFFLELRKQYSALPHQGERAGG
ncbi:MAG: hypothetical protein MMC33_002475 [Icmadophila ericetorum]|nr:hypothetical protein [Icmadophila ericetorum]